MAEILQQKIGVKIELVSGQDEMKINMEGDKNNFYARLEDVQLNPKIVNINNIEIKKNGVVMDFKAPIICNINNIDTSKSMLVGVKFEGLDKDAFVEKIEETAKNFGPEWEKAVLRRKEEILKRNPSNK